MSEQALAYLRDAQACLDLAARGDAFQIAAAKYKVEEAQRLLTNSVREPPAPASNQWGTDEAFKTLEMLTSGSSAKGAMSFLRSQIERLQREAADLQVAYDCATETNALQSAKLRAAHEPPAPASKELVARLRARRDVLDHSAVNGHRRVDPSELEIAAADEIELLQRQKSNLLDTVTAKQARIDALMLEFCPGEISPEPPALAQIASIVHDTRYAAEDRVRHVQELLEGAAGRRGLGAGCARPAQGEQT